MSEKTKNLPTGQLVEINEGEYTGCAGYITTMDLSQDEVVYNVEIPFEDHETMYTKKKRSEIEPLDLSNL